MSTQRRQTPAERWWWHTMWGVEIERTTTRVSIAVKQSPNKKKSPCEKGGGRGGETAVFYNHTHPRKMVRKGKAAPAPVAATAPNEPWQRLMIAGVGGVTLVLWMAYTLLHFNHYYTTNVLYNLLWFSRFFLVTAGFGEVVFVVAPKSDERVLKAIFLLAIQALFIELTLGFIFLIYSVFFLYPLYSFYWISILVFLFYDFVVLVPIVIAIAASKRTEADPTVPPPTSKQTTSRKIVDILWLFDLFVSLIYLLLYILFVSTYTSLQYPVISIMTAIITTNWILVMSIIGDPYESSVPNASGMIFLILFLVYSFCGRLFVEGVNIIDLVSSIYFTGFLLSGPNIIFFINLVFSTILALFTAGMVTALIVDYSQIKLHRD